MIWISLIGIAIQAVMFILKLMSKGEEIPSRAKVKLDQLLISCNALQRAAKENYGFDVPKYDYLELMEQSKRAKKPKGV